jgi:UrcA family protein
MPTLTKTIVAFAILAAGGAAAGNAAAQDAAGGAPPTVVVSYADLDLGSAAGRDTLTGRIHAAASRVCPQEGRQPLQRQLAERRCRSMAIATAKANMDQAVAQRAVQMAQGPDLKLTAR